jgi:hypothetical protein
MDREDWGGLTVRTREQGLPAPGQALFGGRVHVQVQLAQRHSFGLIRSSWWRPIVGA